MLKEYYYKRYNVGIYVGQKSAKDADNVHRELFCHNLTKYWPTFNLLYWHTIRKVCNKVSAEDSTTPETCRNTTL